MLRLWWRSLKSPAYAKHIAERFGFIKKCDVTQPCIWVHAVSVGETIAAEPLIERLLIKYPKHRIHISSMTPTGRDEVAKRFVGRVSQSYAPYDFPLFIALFLQRLKPSALLVMETELWPNTIHACHQRGIKTALLNGRMSERSVRGYQKFIGLTRPMMQNLDIIAAQFTADFQRYLSLGATISALHEVGNIKFDIKRPDNESKIKSELITQILPQNNRPIIVVASTHEGEDELLLPLINSIKKQSQVKPLWLWVPRHPERFDVVAQLFDQQGLSYCRRSLSQAVTEQDVYLVDTIGELNRLYAIATIAIIGGSFIERGGHNMLEAALWGLPIVTGRSDFNFSVISEQLQVAGAMKTVTDIDELLPLLLALLNNKTKQQQMGLAARAVLEKNQGSLEKTLGLLIPLLTAE